MIFGRSLKIGYSSHQVNEAPTKCCEIFERLVEEGVLKNNRELFVSCNSWPHIPRLLGNICSMKKLDTLKLVDCEITLEQLLTLFRSCPELVELSLELDAKQKLEMDNCLKNKLTQLAQCLANYVTSTYLRRKWRRNYWDVNGT